MLTVFPALKELALRGTRPQVPPERCDLCHEPVPAVHRHVLEAASGEISCVCQACGLLFQRQEASLGKYRLIPDRRLRLDGFHLDDRLWERLCVPVGLAFFVSSTSAQGPVAYYPGPTGATASPLEPAIWQEVERCHPALAGMARDIEALLVNRARGARLYYVVPLDECYRLVATIRTRWKGLSGGQDVWEAIAAVFDRLERIASREAYAAIKRTDRRRQNEDD